jgi:hypothetical protein
MRIEPRQFTPQHNLESQLNTTYCLPQYFTYVLEISGTDGTACAAMNNPLW